jgi:hypothetical protein
MVESHWKKKSQKSKKARKQYFLSIPASDLRRMKTVSRGLTDKIAKK